MEENTEIAGTVKRANNSFRFIGKAKDFAPIPLTFSRQIYDAEGKPRIEKKKLVRDEITNERLEEILPNRAFLEKPLIVCMFICLENAVFNASNFERLITSAREKFKQRKVHFAIIVADELQCHNLAKNSLLSTAADEDSESPDILCINANDKYREEARKLGDNWVESIAFDVISHRLSCKIDIFHWREIDSNFTQTFSTRMGITLPAIEPEPQITQEELAKFVRMKLDKKNGFRHAVAPLLDEQWSKDKAKFKAIGTLDMKGCMACNENYLLDEVVRQMTLLLLPEGLIHVVLTPEIGYKRNSDPTANMPIFGEVLDFWSRKLLTEALLTLKNITCDFTKNAKIFHYISAKYFTDALITTAPPIESLSVLSGRKKSRNSTPESGEDHSARSEEGSPGVVDEQEDVTETLEILDGMYQVLRSREGGIPALKNGKQREIGFFVLNTMAKAFGDPQANPAVSPKSSASKSKEAKSPTTKPASSKHDKDSPSNGGNIPH